MFKGGRGRQGLEEEWKKLTVNAANYVVFVFLEEKKKRIDGIVLFDRNDDLLCWSAFKLQWWTNKCSPAHRYCSCEVQVHNLFDPEWQMRNSEAKNNGIYFWRCCRDDVENEGMSMMVGRTVIYWHTPVQFYLNIILVTVGLSFTSWRLLDVPIYRWFCQQLHETLLPRKTTFHVCLGFYVKYWQQHMEWKKKHSSLMQCWGGITVL